MSELTRRRVLAAGGVAAAGAIAGCSSGSADEDDGPEGTVLGELTVDNLHDDTHTIDVLVELDREIDHWSTHELEPRSGVDLERDWSTDPGQFRVTVRLDGDELTRMTPATGNDPACLNLSVIIRDGGDLVIRSGTDGGPCDEIDPGRDDASAADA